MNKRHYEHTLPNIRGSLSNTYIDEILQGGTPNRPTHSTPKEGKKGEALARTSLEYPLELHRKVKKYAVDAGMKEKQVIAQAIREFFERVEKE